MRRRVHSGKKVFPIRFALLLAVGATIGAPGALFSVIAPEAKAGSLVDLAVESESLVLRPALEELEGARSRIAPAVDDAWNAFRLEHGAWTAYLDARSGRIESAEGEGLPWIPGAGNRLKAAGTVGLGALEGIARRFVADQAALLGLDGKDLVLSAGRSGAVSDSLWYVDFDVRRAGIPIEGARVVFRVNHGNLIQFGLENVPPAGVAVPKVAVTAEQAGQIVAGRVGGLAPGRDEILDSGSLHLLPSAENDARFAEGFAFGKGYGFTAVWEITFRRAGDLGLWRARVDATGGELLSLVDVNRYTQATGGVILNAPSLPDTVKAMPWADLSDGTFTNENGRFPGGPFSSTLDGQYVRIHDGCGAISANTDPTGNLPFGASASGTDCATPGFGGAGNTRSARTTFFWLNRAKEIARGWLPAAAWLSQGLVSNVNLAPTCNAYWDGSSVRFFQARPPCGNTGELPGVAIHEFGHGLDDNDGNPPPEEWATGESNGDLLAALVLHRSCVGPGFFSSNCGGYGDACTSCNGVRDIDWARHASNTPHTAANFIRSRCPLNPGPVGPCGTEPHCESMVPSEAVWDFVNRDLPNPGGAAAWNLMERLWFVTRPTAGQSFTCFPTGTNWQSSGCNVGALWKVLRAADDDDGNLANGTPHGAALYAAFNRHGLACLTDPGIGINFAACAPPAVPVVAATPGNDRVSLSWNGAGGGTVYDVYRNDLGCNAAFAKISSGTASTVEDSTVVNNQTYYYQVVARPSGNESCASAPSTCKAVVPKPPCHKALLYSNDFETGTGLADWVQRPVVAGSGTKNWRGIQACPAASGTGIFRFGGATCTGDYGVGEYAYAQPHGAAGIGLPVGTLSPRLTFSHRRAFEAGRNGAMLAVSVDGGPYEPVPASAITSGGYDGTIDSSCAPEGTFGLPVWTGGSAGFTQTSVDLSGFCLLLHGGCGGHSLGIAFTAITDCGGTDDGWFLDDVAVSACIP
ncbi:MAG TPA: hypothetical protein VGS22_30380 [Thermoanaerobaculia bacterium]|nr:hypothetical protein [Thermoanaerobaculia bacterium]